MTQRQHARDIAKQAFSDMLRHGWYVGQIGDWTWRFDADQWQCHVTARDGKLYTFTPAKSWLV